MASTSILLTALLFGGSLAATAESQTTWAAVTFTYHGEKTPDVLSSAYTLTPIGAQQLVAAGSAIRDRYVSGNATNITEAFPINGLSANAIDNSQLFMLATDDEYVAASAQAFVQGLYPPVGSDGQGGQILGNGTLENYPLGGYQYPNIGTVSSLDYNYISLAGNIGCTAYDIDEVSYIYSLHYENIYAESEDFYTSLQSSVFSSLDPSTVNYANAYTLYEYALYESVHNGSVLNSISDSDLNTLYRYASIQQYALNSGNISTINPIAGETLAGKVLEMFGHNIASSGVSDKLTLLFGSYEPFLAFFSLSNLSTAYQYNSKFSQLPLHGSTMSFELFSNTPTSSSLDLNTPFPATSDLYVRFLFRNGTSDSEELLSYSLFCRGNSESDMSYTDFVTGMATFAMTDLSTWCETCVSDTLFCSGIAVSTPSSPSTPKTKTMKPWIAGLIGAAVTLAVCLIAAIVFVSRTRFQRRRSSLGGFKGAEKKPSDADAEAEGEGEVRRERVGSWELRDKKTERVVSTADYSRKSEDSIAGVDPFGEGVKALDQV